MATWNRPFGPGQYIARIGDRWYRVASYKLGKQTLWDASELDDELNHYKLIKGDLKTMKEAKRICEEHGEKF